MKNKRTKLTAILLSALMAVSTISSVTWAADLFTDDISDAALVADPVFVSEGLEIPSEEIESSVEDFDHSLSASGVDESFNETIGNTTIYFDIYGVYPTTEVNSGFGINVRYKLSTSWDGAEGTEDGVTVKECVSVTRENSNCKHPERDLYTFSWDASHTYSVYRLLEDYDEWNSKKPIDKHDWRVYSIVAQKGDCETQGIIFTYEKCAECNAVKDPSDLTDSIWDNTDDPEEYYNNNFKTELDAVTDPVKKCELAKEIAKRSGASIFKLTISEKSGHTFVPDDVNYTWYDIIPPVDSVYYDSTVGDREKWKIRNNCDVDKSTGSIIGPIDSSKPCIYYKIEKCKNCNKEFATEIQVGNPDVTEGNKFIKAGVNVKGFITTNKKDNSKNIVLAKQIAESDAYTIEIVRENCKANASIIHVTRIKDELGVGQWIEGETEWLGPGHTWGIDPKYMPWDQNDIDDFSSELKKDANGDWIFDLSKLTYGSDGFPVVKSKDCITDAYYKFVDECYVCGTAREGSGTKTAAVKGAHDLDESTRFTDYKLTKYTKVDNKHHLESYTDVIYCGLCGTRVEQRSKKGDALVDHKLIPTEVKDSKIPATCGQTGSYLVKDTCICTYVDDDSEEKVIIPATDKHEWESTTPFLEWSGQVFINDRTDILDRTFHVDIVRKCKNCGLTDSNGINGTKPQSMPFGDPSIRKNNKNRNDVDDQQYDKNHYDGETYVPGGKYCAEIHVDRDSIVDAKKDPNTGVPYPCSTASATIYVDWVGTVDGEVVKINSETTPDAVKENVPYYETADEYKGRTAHTPGKPQKEGDNIVTRCTVCGDIVATVPDTTPSVDVPTVSATSVDFDTVNVSWTKIEGATAYRLYYRSSDEGISKWTKIRTFTGDTTSYPVNGLTTGSKYRFTVRAEVTQDGKTTLGDYSKKGAVAVPKLTAPEIKSVTASGKTTKVTWSRVDGASGYIVFRNSQRVGTVTKGSKLFWTDKKSVSGAKYQVRAYRTEDKKNYKSDLSEPK